MSRSRSCASGSKFPPVPTRQNSMKPCSRRSASSSHLTARSPTAWSAPARGASSMAASVARAGGKPGAHQADPGQYGAMALAAARPRRVLRDGQHSRIHAPRGRGRHAHPHRARRRRQARQADARDLRRDGGGRLQSLLERPQLHQDGGDRTLFRGRRWLLRRLGYLRPPASRSSHQIWQSRHRP